MARKKRKQDKSPAQVYGEHMVATMLNISATGHTLVELLQVPDAQSRTWRRDLTDTVRKFDRIMWSCIQATPPAAMRSTHRQLTAALRTVIDSLYDLCDAVGKGDADDDTVARGLVDVNAAHAKLGPAITAHAETAKRANKALAPAANGRAQDTKLQA